VVGRPKQFATIRGIAFSGLGSLFFLLQFPRHNVVGSVFMGGLAGASGMEGFLDFWVGSVIFRMRVELSVSKNLGRKTNEKVNVVDLKKAH
jgi:hypothetical protein